MIPFPWAVIGVSDSMSYRACGAKIGLCVRGKGGVRICENDCRKHEQRMLKIPSVWRESPRKPPFSATFSRTETYAVRFEYFGQFVRRCEKSRLKRTNGWKQSSRIRVNWLVASCLKAGLRSLDLHKPEIMPGGLRSLLSQTQR
jgi:hypothetical protein